MPCYKPLLAYHAPGGISFNRKSSFGTHIELPCGRCIGCRLEKSKEWAIRCVHENQMHEASCFLTLTYRDEDLPKNATLKKSDFQTFIRALRDTTKSKIRYYMCGEYGDATARPHYHALLFGYEFPDASFWQVREKHRIYRSPLLEKVWPHGHSEIGSVTFQSAAYVARYIMKKVKGDRADEHYNGRLPEYTQMSLRPGIGFTWYQKFKDEVWQNDTVITPDGREMPAPKYYRRLLERENPELHNKLKLIRVEKAQTNPDNTPDRLATREFCQHKKAERLIRNYL